MRAKPVTIDSPHSGFNGENFEPSTIRAMISVASNGMRSSAETMPYNPSAAYAEHRVARAEFSRVGAARCARRVDATDAQAVTRGVHASNDTSCSTRDEE